ncbi:GNAT family protein [Agreia sp. VKM Ac-1783]|uniref:GNAT family N-acetyltransferase n=1 Tax=Agreia sp. VKM Ac-1783 TaxID=1938889 RepID=UPI000A2ABFB2|nr:GNAT family protein [Agreia sp. VKM Ac-1783]SMQ57762.1 Protein N-acetyltransferase, RimJ/RimL family [Agreia sp. VKM Ac-1783]
MTTQLETPRLILRRWRSSDREPYSAMNADPEVMRYFPSVLDRQRSDVSADRLDAGFDLHGHGRWALERRDTGEFIGFTGVGPMPEGVPGAGGMEVGWRIARAHWRQGFALEAATAALDAAFAPDAAPQLVEVNSITAVGNEPSRGVMRRLGMRHVDDFEHPGVPEGSPVRACVRYILSRDEWMRSRSDS